MAAGLGSANPGALAKLATQAKLAGGLELGSKEQ